MGPLRIVLLLIACAVCVGCGNRSEQSVLLPPQTSAELVASGSELIMEVYNHGPATVETQLESGDQASTDLLPPQVGWMRTLRENGRVVLTNPEDERRAVVDVIVRQSDGLRFTQPVMPLDPDVP